VHVVLRVGLWSGSLRNNGTPSKIRLPTEDLFVAVVSFVEKTLENSKEKTRGGREDNHHVSHMRSHPMMLMVMLYALC
jgi:hypothetical protein